MRPIPTHPGELLRDDVLPELEKTVQELADHLGVLQDTLQMVLDEQASLTPDLALRLERAVGGGAQMWLNMQANHDLARLRVDAREELERITPLRERAA